MPIAFDKRDFLELHCDIKSIGELQFASWLKIYGVFGIPLGGVSIPCL